MDLISFAFIPQPSLVNNSELWSDVHVFSGKMPSGGNEDVFAIALRCTDKSEIQSLVMNIMYEAIQKSPTDYNVQVAAWSSWCTSLLLQNPMGRLMSENTYNYLRSRKPISVSRYDIMYLPADDATWPIFCNSVRKKMGG